jgi:hypothetical protein
LSWVCPILKDFVLFKNSNLDGEKICNFVMQFFAKNFENVNEIYPFEKPLPALATLADAVQIESSLLM